MKQYRRALGEASAKTNTDSVHSLSWELQLPLADLMAGIRDDIETFSAQAGLLIIQRVMEEEVRRRLGNWGQQTGYRHGRQAGYVVFGGRKVAVTRPRMRQKGGGEIGLESYAAFQRDGRMQRAVARQLARHCSTRHYAGAIEACLQGYGIDKSSVSRHWKAVTEAQMQKLCQRPVPSDLVALIIDGQQFGGECVGVALGVDRQGNKHVLGLWQGATENTTVVRSLLADLVERGLAPSRATLVVIDGAKALRKAVAEVFGQRALVQRCRVHKQRNVVEHLPKQKQKQAIWRLRAAWGKPSALEAERELRAVARWLEGINPMAARSLEEGLEETLTLQRLGVNDLLCRSLSSTNLIESCFAQTRHWTRRVKRWRAKMVLRWCAAALLAAEGSFRKVRGFRYLYQLEEALNNYNLEQERKAA